MNNQDSTALTKLLILIVGSALAICIVFVGVATAVVRTSWWVRRRRSRNRLHDAPSRSNKNTVSDKLFHATDTLLKALAFEVDEDSTTELVNIKAKSAEKSSRLDPALPDIPLRFQPEKLYGATSTIHRENLRKKSCANLSVSNIHDHVRRSSMVEGLLTLSTNWTPKSNSKDAEESLIKPQISPNSTTAKAINERPASVLPQIDITCEVENDNLKNCSFDSTENIQSDIEKTSPTGLSISLPVRRASATNFELSTTWLEKQSSDIHSSSLSKEDENSQLHMNERNCSAVDLSDSTITDADRLPRKNSLFSQYPFRMRKGRNSLSGTVGEYSGWADTQIGKDSSAAAAERLAAARRLPPTPVVGNLDCPAGMLAIMVEKLICNNNETPKLILEVLMAKRLNSSHPWQRSSYSLHFIYSTPDSNQGQTLIFKDVEFGQVKLNENCRVMFDIGKQQNPKLSCDKLLLAESNLRVDLFESLSKWSGDKEYFQGTVSIPVSNLEPQFPVTAWYYISAAYPVVRLKGDLLVSLCLRSMEGIISIGIHELRNLEYQACGPCDIEDLNLILDNKQVGIDIHACLTCSAKLVKAKKSVQLQNPAGKICTVRTEALLNRRGSSESPLRVVSKPSKSTQYTTHRQSGSSEHFIQFALPDFRKSNGQRNVSHYGIVLYVTSKLSVADSQQADGRSQLKTASAADGKHVQALGECFIGDQYAQSEFWQQTSCEPKTDSQSAFLWNEAICHGTSRVYQWLTLG